MREKHTADSYSHIHYSLVGALNRIRLRYFLSVSHILLSLILFQFYVGCATTPDSDDIKKSEAYYKLGVAYLNNGQFSEAFIEFQKSIKLNSQNKESLNYLGYISTRFKKYDEAISYFQRAISIDSNYSDAMNNLGVLYLDLENWDEAIKYFKAAVGNPVYRTPEKAYSSMGYAYYRKGNFIQAKHFLNEALIRNPVFAYAHYTLGLVHMKLEEHGAAIEEFNKTIGIIPEYVNAHWELANAYLKSGKSDKALMHFKIVAEKEKGTERSKEALEFMELLDY